MSKIGKKYILASQRGTVTGGLKNLFNIASGVTRYGNVSAFVEQFEETYNNNTNFYEGKVVFGGDLQSLSFLEGAFGKELSGKRATDIRFSVDTHADEVQEIKDKTALDMVNVYKSKTVLEYNFLIKNYERFLNANPTISETALPYFYDVLTDFIVNGDYKQFVGTNFFEDPQSVIVSNKNDAFLTNVVPTKVNVSGKNQNIGEYLRQFNIYKEQFPFFTDITFDTHELGTQSIISAVSKKDFYTEMFEKILSEKQERILSVEPEADNKKLLVWDLDFQTALYNRIDSIAETDFTFIFDINQRVDGKARTFLEIMNGKSEYSEVVGYHLKKYEGTTNRLVQEWFLPNTNEGTFNWIDSQIKYNKLYTYKLDLVVLTFATEYEIPRFRMENGKLVLYFKNKPLIKVFVLRNLENAPKETLGSTYTNKLLDSPPLDPEIEIIPYIGVEDKVKINLNTAVGQKTVPFINFGQNEIARKIELQLAQNKDPEKGMLTFQSDEPSEFMEVYRLDFHPKGYEDFFDRKLLTLSTDGSSGASFEDTIGPGKKYYYTARSLDWHNNVSNPTPVYQVEIINDGGLILPLISVVGFDKKENNKELSKGFKKYLKIQPATRHREINAEKLSQNNLELGTQQISPWNKPFKLRLVSKSSGKKIDVNFTFKYKKP